MRRLTSFMIFYMIILLGNFSLFYHVFLTQRKGTDTTIATTATIELDDDLPVLSACSVEQMSAILHQLPKRCCVEKQRWPWSSRCSFSFATQCPDSIWLRNAIIERHESQQKNDDSISIYVGCNKGMDAINTLRMTSGNETYDKVAWRNHLFANEENIHEGHCNQTYDPQFEIPAHNNVRRAVVHCVEPLPVNSQQLIKTARALKYDEYFQVHQVAMSSENGIAYFPKANESKLGAEQVSIESCNHSKLSDTTLECQKVPIYTLDSFMQQTLNDDSSMIDFLSIDTEGFDPQVLKGASKTLPRVKYLEFEYNWKEGWADITLSSVIEDLKLNGFACYWAGVEGNLWRITDCWHDHYDLKYWSNVACVNTREQSTKTLVQIMERMFNQTLEYGKEIQYDTLKTKQTSGKKYQRKDLPLTVTYC